MRTPLSKGRMLRSPHYTGPMFLKETFPVPRGSRTAGRKPCFLRPENVHAA